jgi:hypothetical protein
MRDIHASLNYYHALAKHTLLVVEDRVHALVFDWRSKDVLPGMQSSG